MSFNKLVGQQELRHSLTSMLLNDRLSHATLFTGPSGIGKKSWGLALVQAILCPFRSKAGACMKCDSCRQFLSGNHPDYFFLQPDGRNIKIEQIRVLRKSFYLLGGRKVCLIDRAEMMTAEACSSLLKILEEPPAGLYFILLAEQPRLLFDTILSRCQRYKLQLLSCEQVQNLLIKEKGMAVAKAGFLAKISGGVAGSAFDLADDEEFEKRFKEARNLASRIVSGRESAYSLLSTAASLADKEDLVPFLELLCLFYRDCLVNNLCQDDKILINPGQLMDQQGLIPASRMEEIILLINAAIYELTKTNANRRLSLEKMLILMQRRLMPCPG